MCNSEKQIIKKFKSKGMYLSVYFHCKYCFTMKMNYKKIVILLSLQFNLIKTARILAVLPMPSISHQIVFQPLTRELARRGHQVTVITPDPAYPKGQAPGNLIEIDVRDISYETWVKGYVAMNSTMNVNNVSELRIAFKLLEEMILAQASTIEVREIILKKKGEFDLILVEFGSNVILGYARTFNVPIIQISSFGILYGLQISDPIGISSHPLVYPNALHRQIYNLTFTEKLILLLSEQDLKNVFDEKIESQNLMKTIFGPDVPTARELINRNIHMNFRNNHRFWIDNQPSSLNLVYLGGMHILPPKSLPQDLQSYLDSAENGVIYMSLGTNVKMSVLSAEKLQIFIQVFSDLPYKILLKYDSDTLPGTPENVRISKWFPQSDLLHHPKLKLFITQGGLQSTDEAIHAGVPLIGIPVIGDQFYNSEKFVRYKIGKQLDMKTLTKEQFREAIDTVIGDKSYRENIVHLRTIVEDQPTTALERAVWWTEHVLRRDGEHFYAGEANVSWTEYIELELILIALSVVLCGITLFCWTIRFLYKRITQKFFVILKVKEN